MDSAKMFFIANKFRRGLKEYFRLHPEITFSTNFMDPLRGKFPTDHCKAASHAFASYLIDELHYLKSDISYVWGKRGSETHGWLQCGDLFVDLTADQFSDNQNPVFIISAESSEWHATFNPFRRSPFDLREDHPIRELAKEVSKLIKHSPAA